MKKTKYENPLVERYATDEMSRIFSPQFKFSNWRHLWILLAEAERELGLPVTKAQIAEMKRYRDRINFAAAEKLERELRHDVMAHVKAFGLQAKKAAPIIHLGATSAFVGDNTDIITVRAALRLVAVRLAYTIDRVAKFALKHKNVPTLGFTHFQPAQPTTVGKRAALWLQDLVLDLQEIERRSETLPLRGAKGTTGTQASFLELFNGSAAKVKRLEKIIAKKLGFKKVLSVCGQTYTRKIDYQVLSALSGIAQSASKFATDIRLLASMKEVEEPFGGKQIGSSAMAYKRNPMRSERICSLARFVISLPANAAATAATQWFERTLDDSANRRIVIPEAFLATDAILTIAANVAGGLVVNPKMVAANLDRELPFMATENILMEAVKAGGSRQELHERIRRHAMAAAKRVKGGRENDLLERITNDPAFARVKTKVGALANVKKFTGLAATQTSEFVANHAMPAIRKYRRFFRGSAKLKV